MQQQRRLILADLTAEIVFRNLCSGRRFRNQLPLIVLLSELPNGIADDPSRIGPFQRRLGHAPPSIAGSLVTRATRLDGAVRGVMLRCGAGAEKKYGEKKTTVKKCFMLRASMLSGSCGVLSVRVFIYSNAMMFVLHLFFFLNFFSNLSEIRKREYETGIRFRWLAPAAEWCCATWWLHPPLKFSCLVLRVSEKIWIWNPSSVHKILW